MNIQRYSVASRDVVARVIDGEAIIINLASGLYYGTRGSGAVIWEGVEAGRPMGEIVHEICRQFSVTAEIAEHDVQRMIGELIGEQLIRPDGMAEQISLPQTPGQANSIYQAPNLAKYTDMAQFLALDPPLPSLEP
jgi:hypothetical protein